MFTRQINQKRGTQIPEISVGLAHVSRVQACCNGWMPGLLWGTPAHPQLPRREDSDPRKALKPDNSSSHYSPAGSNRQISPCFYILLLLHVIRYKAEKCTAVFFAPLPFSPDRLDKNYHQIGQSASGYWAEVFATLFTHKRTTYINSAFSAPVSSAAPLQRMFKWLMFWSNQVFYMLCDWLLSILKCQAMHWHSHI